MKREDIVAFSADLAKYTDLHFLGSATPGRFCPMGMAEQLLMSAAAGWGGFVPFAATDAVLACTALWSAALGSADPPTLEAEKVALDRSPAFANDACVNVRSRR